MNHLAFFRCAALLQDGWLPFEQIRLPVDDLGFRQGVTAVERLRTYAGEPFEVDRHLQRFAHTCQLIEITGVPDTSELHRLIDELLDRNRAITQSLGDLGITLWATPGQRGTDRPTFAVHLNRIDHQAVRRRRAEGQTVVLTDVVQPDARCWSRQAKARSRLHYYLADRRAEQVADGATGVLQDADGSWTESSVANLALVSGDELLWPPSQSVLAGISQTYVRELAVKLELKSRELPITTIQIRSADALLLMGTDTGLWFAKEVFGSGGELVRTWQPPRETSVVRRLQSAW